LKYEIWWQVLLIFISLIIYWWPKCCMDEKSKLLRLLRAQILRGAFMIVSLGLNIRDTDVPYGSI